MRKSKKTIIYMLVALFAAVSTVLVDFNISYAQSSYSDVPDADWKLMQGGNVKDPGCNVGISDNYSTDFPVLQQSLDKAKYTESCAYLNCDFKSGTSYVLESDTEIVLVCQNSSDGTPTMYGKEGSMYFCALSQSRIYSMLVGYKYDTSVSGELQSTSFVETSNTNNYKIEFTDGKISGTDLILKTLFNTRTDGENKQLEYAVYTGKMKVFSSVSDAEQYFKTGDTSNMAWQGGTPKQTYNSELAFTSFDMSVHDSNSFDDYYLEFIYKCPDSWLGKNPKLVINQTWDYNIYYFNNKGTSQPYSVDGSNTCTLTVSGNNNSVKIPLGQLDCLKKVVSDNFLGQSSAMKRQILGASFSMNNGHYFTFNGLPIMADGSCKVDKSLLSLSCVVYVDGVAGHEYVGSVDLISGDNSMSTYTPDASGNYTYNDDYRKNGHYYTDVSKDAAGNTTYNYYYYGTDGSKKDVSANDAANNTVSNTIQEGAIQNNNNPTFTNNNNITVEGDTISNDVNNYVGNNTSSETNKNFIEKFLGFFQLLENNSFLGVWGKVFGWLPPGISSVITTALGIGACVGLFRFFRR